MEGLENAVNSLGATFLQRNYDYMWLSTMLKQGVKTDVDGATLIIGSSYALSGIYEGAWKRAFNCSMHSQDMYYNYLCAGKALEGAEKGKYARCIVIMGYYSAFQDLSLSTVMREKIIANIYYPIFKDAHNWETPFEKDLWEDISCPQELRPVVERAASLPILKRGTYYSLTHRAPYFTDLDERSWQETSDVDRQAMGAYRAGLHNKIFEHKHSFVENKEIFRALVDFLYSKDVLPVMVIPPATREYQSYIIGDMKEAVLELVDSVPQGVHYVDFNETPFFDAADFMDTDHLNEQGARKMSLILADLFGR